MDNKKILEMLNQNRIIELKEKVSEEIYIEELKKSKRSNADKRFRAMKRYYKFAGNFDERLNHPCKDLHIMINGKENMYNCFLDGLSFVLTTESIGTIDDYTMYTKKGTEYFDMNNYIKVFEECQEYSEWNLNVVLSEAKSKGYKFKHSELLSDSFIYAWNYRDAYYKMGILDQAFEMINDGKSVKLYYINAKSPLFIVSSVGLAAILPMYFQNRQGKIVIKI